MDTAARRCAECGAEFTWTSRNPTRRFCGSRCKTRWWRAHHRGAATAATVDAAATEATADAADAADRTHHRSQAVPVPPLSTGHECPNCGQHITVLNLIVAADGGSGSTTLTG
ncbi:DNA gyrase inhibitor YacG [Streptomyces sp. Inha503]|uniref:DNA gyrase inhibitor YacG n=1 Tax=Streptomyces sp. Inha503 TaxID=3383314 RepID=UPI0039A2C6A0